MAPVLKAETLRDERDFARIAVQISELRRSAGAEDDLHSDPDFVLACADSVRRCCSIACWHGDKLVGLLFAFQHYAKGAGSGYALAGDYSGRGGLLALPEYVSAVIGTAVAKLMRQGIHALHLRISPAVGADPELSGFRVKQFREIIPGDRLKLAESYDEFLASLGKHTRRNIRAYTRRAASAGLVFDPHVPVDEYVPAVQRLSQAAEFPIVARRLARDSRLMERYSGNRFALRNSSGRIVAALCGFSRHKRFHVLSQVNDSALADFSLSLVLRGLAIEWLILNGQEQVQFMGGTSLALGRFCERLDYQCYFIDRRHLVFTPLKMLAAAAVELIARSGRRVPEALELSAGNFLSADRLAALTPLRPAAVVKREELARRGKPLVNPAPSASGS